MTREWLNLLQDKKERDLGEVEIKQIKHNAYVVSLKVLNALSGAWILFECSGMLREQVEHASCCSSAPAATA